MNSPAKQNKKVISNYKNCPNAVLFVQGKVTLLINAAARRLGRWGRGGFAPRLITYLFFSGFSPAPSVRVIMESRLPPSLSPPTPRLARSHLSPVTPSTPASRSHTERRKQFKTIKDLEKKVANALKIFLVRCCPLLISFGGFFPSLAARNGLSQFSGRQGLAKHNKTT